MSDTYEGYVPTPFPPCPWCLNPLTDVRVTTSGNYTTPCGHRVVVTIWPGRVELERG